MSKTKTHETLSPNYARRRRVAMLAAGLILAPILVKGFLDSHNQYGYDPSRNPAPPTNIDKGVNPADVIWDDTEK